MVDEVAGPSCHSQIADRHTKVALRLASTGTNEPMAYGNLEICVHIEDW
jgi:hypothetical protein